MMENSHVLSITARRILLVGREVHDGTSRDGNVDIALGVTCPDLRTLGVEGNGDLAALLYPLGLASIVNDRLYKKQASAVKVYARKEASMRWLRAAPEKVPKC
jgi:hypothetical protein